MTWTTERLPKDIEKEQEEGVTLAVVAAVPSSIFCYVRKA